MSNPPLMFLPLFRYFDFQGRSRRSEYWLWFLFQVIVGLVFAALQAMLLTNKSGMLMLSGIRGLFQLALFIPNLAVGVRRFHDTGRTGWWILFSTLVMIIACIVFGAVKGSEFMESVKGLGGLSGGAGSANPTQMLSLMMGVLGPIMLWVGIPTLLASIVTFVFNVMDGTPGPNRFGSDPKGRGNVSVF